VSKSHGLLFCLGLAAVVAGCAAKRLPPGTPSPEYEQRPVVPWQESPTPPVESAPPAEPTPPATAAPPGGSPAAGASETPNPAVPAQTPGPGVFPEPPGE